MEVVEQDLLEFEPYADWERKKDARVYDYRQGEEVAENVREQHNALEKGPFAELTKKIFNHVMKLLEDEDNLTFMKQALSMQRAERMNDIVSRHRMDPKLRPEPTHDYYWVDNRVVKVDRKTGEASGMY